jgi:hypothetical protein
VVVLQISQTMYVMDALLPLIHHRSHMFRYKYLEKGKGDQRAVWREEKQEGIQVNTRFWSIDQTNPTQTHLLKPAWRGLLESSSAWCGASSLAFKSSTRARSLVLDDAQTSWVGAFVYLKAFLPHPCLGPWHALNPLDAESALRLARPWNGGADF